MDNLKLFAKSIDQINSLEKTGYVFSEDIGMDCGLKKCGFLVLKRGKVVKMDGVTLPDGQAMKQLDKDTDIWGWILELEGVKEGEMKIQCQKGV